MFLLARRAPTVAPKLEPMPPHATGLPKMASFKKSEAAPGFVICDVCGRENDENNRVCETCDVPLPVALRYVDLNSPIDAEHSGLRDERRKVELPEPPGKKASYRKKLLLMLLVTTLLVAWQARGRIIGQAFLPARPAPPKPASLPSQLLGIEAKTSKERKQTSALLPSAPEPPEVTVRSFPLARRQTAKTSSTKHNANKTGAAASTIPDDAHLPKATSSTLDLPAPAEQAVVLPLNDQDVLSTVRAPSRPTLGKPRETGFWKRVGGKLFGGERPAVESK